MLAQASMANRPGYHGSGHTQWGCLNSNSESTSSNVADGSSSALIINDIRNSTTMLSNHSESSSTLPQNWAGELRGSFSTSTMESTLPVTPSENAPSHPKSQNINAMMNQPLPVHQGRNPTVERNTHKRSDEELAVVGMYKVSEKHIIKSSFDLKFTFLSCYFAVRFLLLSMG